MKITEIEVIPVVMPLAARYGDAAGRVRMGGIDDHVVVKVHTDNGLTGYGDYEDHPTIDAGVVDRLIGRSPFDFLHNDLNLALGMALYDVMGKYLEVPAHKLMGQKLRDAVPCAAWTRPCSPEVFAGEVRRSAEQGYRAFKMHSNARYDVIEQTRAAADAAPAGFKLHWDFNHNRSPGVVLPILAEMERDHSHIVGFIEDPLPWQDVDGWARLRAKSKIPLIMHVPQLGGIQEVMAGAADIYMTGGGIGRTLQDGFAYGRANVQVLIQQSGGALMKALTLHQAAVLPTATAHTITLDDQYERDIATPVAVDEGLLPRPRGARPRPGGGRRRHRRVRPGRPPAAGGVHRRPAPAGRQAALHEGLAGRAAAHRFRGGRPARHRLRVLGGRRQRGVPPGPGAPRRRGDLRGLRKRRARQRR